MGSGDHGGVRPAWSNQQAAAPMVHLCGRLLSGTRVQIVAVLGSDNCARAWPAWSSAEAAPVQVTPYSALLSVGYSICRSR
jgi:hypothetical protein